MNVREIMNNNPAMVTIGAVVILVLCLGAIMCQLKGPSGRGGPVDLYFLDESSGTLFTAESTVFPPIAAPSDTGGTTSGVRAHVFGCGDCPSKLAGMTAEQVESAGAFIAYLEKYTPESKSRLEQVANNPSPNPEDMEMMYEMEEGRLIRLMGSDEWINANSERGVDVYSTIRDRCSGDERPRQCFPGR